MQELRTYFESIQLPKTLRLNTGELITDVPKCVYRHLDYVESITLKKQCKQAYIDRLILIKELLSLSC